MAGEMDEGNGNDKFVQFGAFRKMDNGNLVIGYHRTDLPLTHGIIEAEPNAFVALWELAEHFDTCEVCKAHKATFQDFVEWCRSIKSDDMNLEFVNQGEKN